VKLFQFFGSTIIADDNLSMTTPTGTLEFESFEQAAEFLESGQAVSRTQFKDCFLPVYFKELEE